MDELAERDQILHVDLAGRDPDDGFTGVPYIKGAMFLQTIQDTVGRDVFDPFLRAYFEEFAFRSVTTTQFAEYLERNLLASRPDVAGETSLKEWLERLGLPADRHEPVSDALEAVAKVAGQWVDRRWRSGRSTHPIGRHSTGCASCAHFRWIWARIGWWSSTTCSA
ncbi:MAG: M1 family aminopeptidase [Bryobacterales bacterium]|nr:M1 family aminopeptidase [Bryobacterales bacterium]